eukprot:scaffold311933_cov30-Prasinocladus_malaysianus.AAC.1
MRVSFCAAKHRRTKRLSPVNGGPAGRGPEAGRVANDRTVAILLPGQVLGCGLVRPKRLVRHVDLPAKTRPQPAET